MFSLLGLVLCSYSSWSQTSTSYNANTIPIGGSQNVGIGREALLATVGGTNTAVGYQSLRANSTGAGNSAVGAGSMRFNTTGIQNTAVGANSLRTNSTGGANTGVGYSALYSNSDGSRLTAIGYQALQTNSSGNDNCAVGFHALWNNSSGLRNIGIGSDALATTTTASDNIGIGHQCLQMLNGGIWNVSIGNFSLDIATTANYNTAVGYSTLTQNSTGAGNTAIGCGALPINSTGNSNTAIGYNALQNTTASNNTAIGAWADVTLNGLTNATAVGAGARVDANNRVRIGDAAVNSIGGQVAWTNFSDGRIKRDVREDVPGLDFINRLRPVTYTFDIQKQQEMLGIKNDTAEWAGKHDIERMRFTGFIAQEVESAAKAIQYDFSGVDRGGAIMGLRYAEFVVPLVQATQEISAQQTQADKTVADLMAEVNALKHQVAELQSSANSQGYKSGSDIASDLPSIAALSLSPNPAGTTTTIRFRLSLGSSSTTIAISDMHGHVMKQFLLGNATSGTIEVPTDTLPSGIYHCTLQRGDQTLATQRLVVAH